MLELESMIELLDKAGSSFTGNPAEGITMEDSNRVLCEYLYGTDSYMYAIPIYQGSKYDIVKYTSLKVIRRCVEKSWNVINNEFKDQIRGFLMDLLNNFVNDKSKNMFLTLIDLILIGIAKQDWPHKWVSFFEDLINESNINYKINSLKIIYLLAEEITDNTEGSLTSDNVNRMINGLVDKIEPLTLLIQNNINKDGDLELTKTALKTLKKLLRIPKIVNSIQLDWIIKLVESNLYDPHLAVPIIGIFTEIVSKSGNDTDIISLFSTLVCSLEQAIGDEFALVSDLSGDERFAHDFILSIVNMFKKHENLLHEEAIQPQLIQVLKWIYILTVGSSQDLYEEALVFWEYLLWFVACETSAGKTGIPESISTFLHQFAVVLIERMPPPLETFELQIDNVKYQQVVNNQKIFGTFCNSSKECILFLGRLIQSDIKNIIYERIQEFFEIEINADSFRSLCWSIGCLVEIPEISEDIQFFSMIFNSLFQLCDKVTDHKEKTDVAEGIVFVCGQCHRFLNQFPSVLKSILTQIFTFIKFNTGLLQEYSLEALKTLASKCRKHLLSPFQNEQVSTLDFLIHNIEEFFGFLKQDNIPNFYEILGVLIQGETSENKKKEVSAFLLKKLINLLDDTLKGFEQSNIKNVSIILQCFSRLPIYLGNIYIDVVMPKMPDLIDFYMYLSQINVKSIQNQIISLKSDIIVTIQKMIYYNDNQNNIIEEFYKPASELILNDYYQYPQSRTHEVIALFGIFSQVIPKTVLETIKDIFNKLLKPSFYNLSAEQPFINSLVKTTKYICNMDKNVLLMLDQEEIELIIKIYDYGLSVLDSEVRILSIRSYEELIGIVHELPNDFIQKFDNNYILMIVNSALSHVFDINCKSSFRSNCSFLRKLLELPYVKSRAGDVAYNFSLNFPTSSKEYFETVKELFQLIADKRSANDFFNYLQKKFIAIQKTPIDNQDFEREKIIAEMNKQFSNINSIQENQDRYASSIANTISSLTIKIQ